METSMKHLGLRLRVPFPETYRGFRLLRAHGRVYATPPSPDPARMLQTGRLFTHPAVLSAATREELEATIDAAGARDEQPVVVGRSGGHDLVRHRGVVHGVPLAAAPVDLDLPEDRRRAGVLSGRTREEVEA